MANDRFAIGQLVTFSLLALGYWRLPQLSAQPADVTVVERAVPTEVRQILKRSCIKCHGLAKTEGKLQLHSAIRIWNGGESGRVVQPGDPAQSLLWQLIAQDEMPPETSLTDVEKQTLYDWIAGGAIGLPRNEVEEAQARREEHWAFTALKPVEPPTVQHVERCRTPIDRFLQVELERVGLSLGGDADLRQLIRRVSFTLTGLPPTPDESAKYVTDQSIDAFDRMVDRYLASPQYGVRWGSYWLDAAGYADSNGYFNADSDRPLAYRYRDYVVRSFNMDKPFDRFVQEQIAGDELSGFDPQQDRQSATSEMIDMLIATHYLRNGQDGSGESDGNPDEVRIDRYTALESAQQIIASSLLGLTIQCAKCHDHKFEPISQLDYYRFQAVLYPAYNPDQWVKPNDRYTMASSHSEYAAWEAEVARAQTQVTKLQLEYARQVLNCRAPSLILFKDHFDQPERLKRNWTNTIPGDDSPAGTSPVSLQASGDVPNDFPAAVVSKGILQIIEGGKAGDKWLATQEVFDWTPEREGDWIQVTFNLVDNKVFESDSEAARIAFGIALHDYDGSSPVPGGNLLIDGNPDGGAIVDLDYPGTSVRRLGQLGTTGYTPGHSYGVRVTHLPNHVYQLQQLVDRVAEGPAIDLSAADLPDGSFGFEFCCGRSFQVDDVVVEVADPTPLSAEQAAFHEAREQQLNLVKEQLDVALQRQTTIRDSEPGRIAWLTDVAPEPPDVYLLARGEYTQPTEKVLPAPFSALDDDFNEMQVVAPVLDVASSGRRSAWSKWVTNPDSRAAHLMARVQVNRVWQAYFGTGLVSTADNLGMSGADPSNVRLLDWLANEFIRHGWSLKSLHRVILRSTVFAQSSLPNEQGLQFDPRNQLLWRYPLKRLDADSIRDGQLAISGELDGMQGGAYVPTVRTGTAEVIVPEDRAGAFRRSIYLQHRRSQGLSLLSVFDAPAMVVNCTRRPTTTMPLQSLSLLNSDFSVNRGRQLAMRIQQDAGGNAVARINRAYLLVTGRECSTDEISGAIEFIQRQQQHYRNALNSADDGISADRAWADFCQLLLASNAFLYIE